MTFMPVFFSNMMHLLTNLGRMVLSFPMEILQFFWFFIRVLVQGMAWPFYGAQWRSCLKHMGLYSIPMVSLTALFTGMVLVLQTHHSFQRFSIEGSLGEVVVLSLTRELAPVLTGLLMAGKWGARLTSELATMRITDQLDALTALSTNPFRYLIFPRILAGLVSLPLLVVLADMVGVLGGYGVAVYDLKVHGAQYLANTWKMLLWKDILCGLVKGAAFGFIVSLVSCYTGYYASGGAQGIGKAATNAVVGSSILILLTNYLLTLWVFA